VVLVAVVVMLAIRWVGLLLINAMLILPAAASRNVARSMRAYHLLSLVFGLFAGVLGLWLSYYNGVATGPTIILVLAAVFFGTFALRKK
jgi:zinc transport system permease protein